MAALCLFFVVIGSGLARAENYAGRRQGLFFKGKGGAVPAPVLGATVEVKVTGIIARAKVTQIFKNVSAEWVEGIYIFPLPGDAAVDSLRLKVGNRTIRGVIQEKSEARKTYEAAKQEGKKASLVEQQLPDVFTTAVANIGPGETVEVAIELQQVVKWQGGRFSLRFPMLVAKHPNATKALGITLPPAQERGAPPVNPFAFHADLYPGFPLAGVESPSHAITVEKGKSFHYAVDLARHLEAADSDLILEWKPAVGREPRAVYYSEEVGGERYSLLMVMPPDAPDAVASRLPRETIFIIDNSGSMKGAKIEQARQALLFGLAKLQPTDWFNVIRFNSYAAAVFPTSVQATPAALATARAFIGDLTAGCGTQMVPALQVALRNPPPAGLVPQVIFATDGQLEDESQVFQFLGASLGDRRLFPVAIGPDPNSHLLGRLAVFGRGSFTAINDVGKVAATMGDLLSRLESPMLQKIEVQWSDAAAEAWPARVPDLYLGEPLVVTARTGAGAGPVTVSGLRGGSSWQDSFPAAAEVKGTGIDKLWARRKIEALADSLREGANPDEVRRAVAELGLRHHLVTDYTSLVAVDETPTAPAGVEPVTRMVPVNPPQSPPQTSGEAVEDVITTTSESPLLDERRLSTGATISQAELEKIPSARDPWAVLQSTPGVLADRINVGGSESGQQSQYVGPGSGGDQAVWSVDGMVVTDMTALGSSPGYYDFDVFEEMGVTTGGSDASIATGGVVVNLITKRGINEWRGSGRYLTSNSSLQSKSAFKQGNRIDKMVDQGVELGGPIVKDGLWAWGSYAQPKIDLLTIDDFHDKTTFKEWNAKLNAQLSTNNSASAFAWQSDKIKQGRNAGPLRPQETTWDQSKLGPNPTAWKAEDTQIVSSSFFVTGMVSQVNGGFQLVPEGGDRLPFRDAGRVWHNSFLRQQIERPQKQGKLDASTFFNLGNLSQELKYGAGYRTAESSTLTAWPGGGFELDLGGPHLLALSRDATPKVKTEYRSLYVQDMLSVGKLTANVGARWDRQGGTNEASSAAANPAFPHLLPAIHYAGQDAGFAWTGVAPRIGLTYALGAERKTLLRASYSRFADQLGTSTAGWLNLVASLGYRYFLISDKPGGIGPEIARPSSNINPRTFGSLQSNAVNRNLSAPLTDEVLLGVEHALLPELVVGLNFDYRKYHNALEAKRLVFDGADPFASGLLDSVGRIHRRSDYVEQTSDVLAPDGRTYTVHYWELRPGISTRNGFYLTNGQREKEFKGVSMAFDKRLSNRWLMRGNVSYQNWKWQIPDGANQDPTDTIAGGVVNGTGVLQGSGTASGPKENVFINSRWSYSLNGLYQIASDRPWSFNVAANLNGRQGYPLRYAERINRMTIGSGIDIPIRSNPDAFRYPAVHVFDLRIEKDFVHSDFDLMFGLDVFNALNASYVLQRQGILARNGAPVSNSDSVLEVLSPRIFRLGARFSFR